MTAAPSYAFTITYDADSVRAAADTLFIMQQRRMLRISVGSLAFCFVTIGGMSWYLHFFWMLWFPLGLLALDIFLRLYTRLSIRRRLERTLTNKVAKVELSDAAFSIASEDGSHVLPWRSFRSTRRDARNLFLCFPRPGAIVLPENMAPEAALMFAEARVRDANAAI